MSVGVPAAATTPHPLADAAGEGWVATETRAPVIALTTAMSDFLGRVSAARARPIVVTGPRSRMTAPLRETLTDLAGAWVVRDDEGFHDARSGVVVGAPAEALSLGRRATAGSVAPGFLGTALGTSLRVVVSLSTRHRVSRSVRLGGAAEALAVELTGAAPVAWGATEPVVAPWDRDDLTERTRRRMPADSHWIAVGTASAPLVGTVRIARTREGLEETTRIAVDRGRPGDPRHAGMAEEARRALVAAARHGMPLLGVAFAHVGAPDLSHRPLAEPAPQPLALLIGPPGVRVVGVDPRRWADELGAAVVGSPRLPGVLVPLGSADGGGWERLSEVMSRLDPARVAAALDLAPRIAVDLTRASAPSGGSGDA